MDTPPDAARGNIIKFVGPIDAGLVVHLAIEVPGGNGTIDDFSPPMPREGEGSVNSGTRERGSMAGPPWGRRDVIAPDAGRWQGKGA